MGKKHKGDDMLNVAGLFRAQSKQLAESQSELLSAMEQAAEELDELERIRDKNRALLEQLGVSLQDMDAIPVEQETVAIPEPKKIPLSEDTDYHREFLKLAEEAKAQGYTNVSISALLTEEEQARARERGLQLDRDFDSALQFRPMDMFVLSIGIALHLLRFLMTHVPQTPAAPVPGQGLDIYAANASPVFDDIAGQFHTPASAQAQKVPLAPTPGQTLGSAAQVLQLLPFKRTLYIKSADRILTDTPCFQMTRDIRYPNKSDYLGNHSLWGWIVGVFNIITDTVTVKDMQTFQPELDADPSILHLSREQLPFRDLFLPFVDNGVYGIQDELLAGVIREAYVLIPNEVDYQSQSVLFLQSKHNLAAVTSLMQEVNGVLSLGNFNHLLMDAGWSNLVNTLMIAIHGLFCKKEDNSHQYMVRTMRVVTAANLIGTALSSLPALAAENLLELDYGGLLTGVVNAATLTKLWIDVKAEFLVSEYLPLLEQQLRELDQFFEVI